jgi:hypothetical protein
LAFSADLINHGGRDMNDLERHIEYLEQKKDDLQIDKAFGKDISEETEALNQMIANAEKMVIMERAKIKNLDKGFMEPIRFLR